MQEYMTNTKKVHFIFSIIKKPWWIFTFSHLLLFFTLSIYGLGYTLWIQSLMISVGLSFILLWLFFTFLTQIFKTQPLKGYDPWHLRPLLNQHIPKVSVSIVNHKTPFCFHYDFYGYQYISFSSSLITHLNKNELENLIQCYKIYFENGFSRRLTQWTYWLMFLFLPCFLILNLFKKRNFIQKKIEWLATHFLFLPFYPLIHAQFYQLDRQISSSIKNKNVYFNLLEKLQTYWEISTLKPPLFLSCLFLTNPLTPLDSYFNMQPLVHKRMKRIIKM